MSHRTMKIKRPFFGVWLDQRGLRNELVSALAESKFNPKIGDLLACWQYCGNYHDKSSVNASHAISMTRRMNLRDVTIDDSDEWWRKQKRKQVFYDFIKKAIESGEFFKTEFKESYHYNRIMSGNDARPTIKEVQQEIKDHAKAAANDREPAYQEAVDMFSNAKTVKMY